MNIVVMLAAAFLGTIIPENLEGFLSSNKENDKIYPEMMERVIFNVFKDEYKWIYEELLG